MRIAKQKYEIIVDESGDRAEILLDWVTTHRRSTVILEVKDGALHLSTSLNGWVIRPEGRMTLTLKPTT